MLEYALQGTKRYWTWVFFLLGLITIGTGFYIYQLTQGLTVTGMSRDVSWGFYIAQLTYLVGVAASGVMLVIPYYLHSYHEFNKMVILGEFMAVGAIIMCLLFVIVDLGQPQRLMNLMLHPTPQSILFWDAMVLNGYMMLNLIVGWVTLETERKGLKHYPKWVKPLVYLSVPFAFSIHTVTAFLYAGIPGRHYWLTAIMAARFLASAFASGPAVLLLCMLIVQKLAKFKLGDKAIYTLATIITYAMIINVFFFLLELFTAFYSNIPGHKHSIVYLFNGLEGHGSLVPWFWTATFAALTSIALLVPPPLRRNRAVLVVALILLFIGTWIDKGLGLVVAGFIPNMFEGVTEYAPTYVELLISMGIFATGALIVTVFWKVAISVKLKSAEVPHM
jgi:molybdopterin-containing oxidoreductase family membrane subunit